MCECVYNVRSGVCACMRAFVYVRAFSVCECVRVRVCPPTAPVVRSIVNRHIQPLSSVENSVYTLSGK